MDWEQFIEEIAAKYKLFGVARIIFLETFPTRDEILATADLAAKLNISVEALKKRYQKKVFPAFATIEDLKPYINAKKKGKLDAIHKWLCKEFQNRQQSSQSRSSQQGEKPSRTVDTAKLSNLLLEFDYSAQIVKYETQRKSISPVVAFLVRAECRYVQKWLVKRLSKRLNGFALPDSFQLFPIDAAIEDFAYCGIDSLWSLFEIGGLRPSNQSEVMDLLTKLYAQNKTILIALYGLECLNESVIQDILNFWQDISSRLKFKNISGRGVYSKLVLLLSDSRLEGCPLRTGYYQLEQPLIELIPESDALCSFPEEDVRDFIQKPDFCLPIQERIGIEAYQTRCEDRNRWEQKPQKVLDELCFLSKIDGFATYKEAWDLTYEA